jgi:hypothetical protein
MALGLTQPPTEMTTRNLPGGKGRPVHKADLTAVCELICLEKCGSLDISTLWASTACYRDSFTFFPPTSAEVRNTWMYASTPLYIFMA